MQDDQTLFGKPDTTTKAPTQLPGSPSATDAAAAEAEREEALSRAARQAVRQPADPRIERSFAHLGLTADDPPAAVPTVGRAAPVAPPPPPVDLEPIREELAAWKASLAELSRRLELVTWILFAVTGIIGLLAIVLIIRG